MSTAETKMRDAICALGAKLAARGLCPGTSGNISARVADGWLMTPTNSSLGELLPGQLSKIDLSGKHVAGDPPTKEALLHRSVYDVRPKDGAIVHLHCTHAVAISCLDPSCHHNKETTLPPITPYFVMRVGKLPLDLFELFKSLEVLRRANRGIDKGRAHRRLANLFKLHAVARGGELLKVLDDLGPTRELAIVAGTETEYLLWRRYRSVLGDRDGAPKTRVGLD